MQNDDLDRLFDEMRQTGPEPSSALLDRVLLDAARLQPKPAAPSRPPVVDTGVWHRLFALVGGPPVIAGLCSVALIGIILGYAEPTRATYLFDSLGGGGSEGVDLFPMGDFLVTEG